MLLHSTTSHLASNDLHLCPGLPIHEIVPQIMLALNIHDRSMDDEAKMTGADKAVTTKMNVAKDDSATMSLLRLRAALSTRL